MLGVLDLFRPLHCMLITVRNLEAVFYIFQGQMFSTVYSLRAKFSILC